MNEAFVRKNIVVTGGNGFLGSHLIEELRSSGCENVLAPRSLEYDLRRSEAVSRVYDNRRQMSLSIWRR
jgi:GDP-L-fucose synthase